MKILICEDNERKYNDIREAIRIVMPEAKITWCKYAKTGVLELKNNEYDFLIQDMQLPLNIDDGIDFKGGIYVLHRLQHSQHTYDMNRDIKVCVCSSDIASKDILTSEGFDIPFIEYTSYTFVSDIKEFLTNK